MKKFNFLFALVGLPVLSFAQLFRTYTNDLAVSAEEVVEMQTGSDNSVYICYNMMNGSSNTDIVVKKYTDCGDLVWTNTYDSGENDRAVGLKIDGSDNLYVGGNYKNLEKPFVRKITSGNTTVFTTTIAVTQGATINAMDLDASGQVYLAGYIPTASQGNNSYLIKFTSAGAQAWTRSYDSGSSYDENISHVNVGTNGVYITGLTGTWAMVIRYDFSGTFQWEDETMTTNWPDVTTVDNSDNLYVGNGEILYRYNPNSSIAWNALNLITSDDRTNHLSDLQYDNNYLYYTGWNHSLNTPLVNTNMVTGKIDVSNGSISWKNPYNHPNANLSNDRGYDIILKGDGNFYVGGIPILSASTVSQAGFVEYQPNGTQLASYFTTTSTEYKTCSLGAEEDIFVISENNTNLSRFIWPTPEFQLAINGNDYFCTGVDEVQLQLSVPVGGSFEFSPTTYLSDPLSTDPTVSWVTGPLNMTYYATLNGCEGTASATVYRKNVPSKNFKVNSTQVSSNTTWVLCEGESIGLSPNSAGIEHWWFELGTGFIDNVFYPDTVWINQPGTYQAMIYSQWCENTSYELTVISDSDPIDLGGSQAVCDGQSLVLDAGASGVSYLWSTGETTQSISVNQADTYDVEVTTANGCTVNGTMDLTVNALPIIPVDPNPAVCEGSSLVLDAGPGMQSYNWGGMSNAQIFTVYGNESFSLSVTDFNNCTSNQSILTTISSLPIVDAGLDVTICNGNSANLTATASPGGCTFEWSTMESGAMITVNQENDYIAFATTPEGCVNSDTVHVFVESCASIGELAKGEIKLYPNPAKDKLTIECSDVIDNIEIYNSTGSLVDYIQPSNASKLNVSVGDLPEGVYFIQLKTVDQTTQLRFIKTNK